MIISAKVGDSWRLMLRLHNIYEDVKLMLVPQEDGRRKAPPPDFLLLSSN